MKTKSKNLIDIKNKEKTSAELIDEKARIEKFKLYNEKCEALAKGYTERLNESLATYFNNFSNDEQINKSTYSLLNKEWKSYCQRVNALNKLFRLKHDGFEVETARIIKDNPQFQKGIINLTKIK